MKGKTKIQIIFIGLFILSLCFPTMYYLLNNKIQSNPNEIDFKIEALDSLAKVYNQTHPLKKEFVDINAHLKNTVFNSAPQPHKALIGKDGWFFYNTKSDKIVESYSHKNRLSTDALQSIIDLWTERRNVIEKDSNKLVVAIWPNKSSTYSEFLPSAMAYQIQNDPSKMEQFLSAIKDNSLAEITVDINPIFEAHKSKTQLYQKLDTHWNEDGAYLAYVEIMKKLNMTPFPKSDFKMTYNEVGTGDLIDQSGFLKQRKYKDTVPTYKLWQETVLIDTIIHVTSKPGTWSGSTIYTNHSTGDTIKAVIFGDSYTQALIPFLKLHFSELNFERADYSDRYIKSKKPDIVIESRVERYW